MLLHGMGLVEIVLSETPHASSAAHQNKIIKFRHSVQFDASRREKKEAAVFSQ